jgi:hypothetical protein
MSSDHADACAIKIPKLLVDPQLKKLKNVLSVQA